MAPVRPSGFSLETDRLYLRVIALGCLWCILGVALGSTLYLRLRSVASAASNLSSDVLPVEHSIQRVNEKLAQTEALVQRVAIERRTGEESTATSARLREAIAELEQASRFSPERLLRGAQLDAALHAKTTVTAMVKSTHEYLQREGDAEQEGEDLRAIESLAQEASLGLDHLTTHVMAREVERLASDLVTQSQRIINEAITAGSVAFALGAVLTVAVGRRVRRQELVQARDRNRQDFHARVSDALAMVPDEPGVHRIVEEIVERTVPGLAVEVLLADSSRAHLTAVSTTPSATARLEGCASMCSVRTPSECPAVRRGYPISFDDSDAFDACPHLRGRPGGACAATCVPLSIMGQHVGVLHAVAPVLQPPPAQEVERLTMLAAKVGERLGVIRAFTQSEHQAARDSLTGLMNRRSVEAEVQRLQRAGNSFCIAYADIDHFKRLNDTHGHETGDKALRLFSRVLREALRPTDITGRWGGEEFVILLPQLDIETARVALDRVRSDVLDASVAAAVPKFSVSFGVAVCQPDDDFFERLAEADAALLAAKGAGRNRVFTVRETAPVLGTVKAA